MDEIRQYYIVHVHYNQELAADFWSVDDGGEADQRVSSRGRTKNVEYQGSEE